MKELFAYNLKQIRETKGFNQSEFARNILVSRRTLINYENAIHIPDLKILVKD